MTLISCPDIDQLGAMLNETLPPPRQSTVQAHVDGCTACQQRIEALIRENGAGALPLGVLSEQPELAPNAQRAGAAAGPTIALDSAGKEVPEPATSDDVSLDFLSPPDDPGHLGKLGHYQILAVVGRGGLGIVLKGYDTRLKRIVAIKAPLPELAANAAARKRFAREAEAAAAVSHDHVVTIHAVEPEKYPYLVMEYIDGVSLQDKLDACGSLELKEILRIGMQTARGLAAAHEQGLVHRDIKPANILLENGVQRVKITDFGLARAVDDISVSQTGTVAGTPPFMSPEQAYGDLVDHRSDLFSLGCMIYAMCTGRSPFRAETTLAVLKRVCEDAPKPIRKVNPAIPEWLAEIVGKLLEKKPDRRFQTAREVADLLSRHLAHLQQPEANPQPAPLRSSGPQVDRPARRRFRLAGNALLLFAGLSVVSFVVLQFTPYAGHFGSGFTKRAVLPSSERGPSPAAIARSSRMLSSPMAHADADVYAVAFTKDGGRAVTGGHSGNVEIWDVATGKPRFTLRGHTKAVHAVAISPDERLLATAGEDSVIRLWTLDTAEPVKEIRGHSGWVVSLAFRKSAKELLSVGWDFKNFDDNTIRLWDVETGEARWRIADNLQFPVDMALAPDETWAAVSDAASGRVGLWNLEIQSPLHFFEGFAMPVSVALSHDGESVAAGYHAEQRVDGKWNDPDKAMVRVWNIDSGRLLHELQGHCGSVLSVQFSPDDRYVLSLASDRHDDKGNFVESSDQTARIWDAATGEELARIQIERANVARWLPDGRSICTGVRIWELPSRLSLTSAL